MECAKLMLEEVLKTVRQNSGPFLGYLRKTTGGPLPPPPSGSGLITSEGKMAGYNGESLAMLFDCVCTQYLTNVKFGELGYN